MILNLAKNSHVILHVKFYAELEHFTLQNDHFKCETLNLEICCKQINVHEKFAFHIFFRVKLVVYIRKLISVDFVYVGLHEQFKKSISYVKLNDKYVFLVFLSNCM